jgi:energy-coupling factor transport system ATP-binding protein
VDLEVRDGEVVAILGPTGSGKSTLLEHLAGLLRPTEGKVLLSGRDIYDRHTDRRALRQQVGMLFQRPEEQLFENVGDDVAFGPRRLGLGPEMVRERVRWAMEAAGLPFAEYKDRFTQGLSGGEQRRVALAGVLALRPRVLLLDEPTAGMDPQACQDLTGLLRRLNREEGRTLVVATHSMDLVAAVADRVVVLNDGRIVGRGTPRQLFADPERLRGWGLEPPAVSQLMHRLRAMGIPAPADVLTVEEAVAVLEDLREKPQRHRERRVSQRK